MSAAPQAQQSVTVTRHPVHHLHLDPAQPGGRRRHLHRDGERRGKRQPGHPLDRPLGEGSCSISGATVTFAAVGTCVIDANQAGNASYAAATQVQQSFDVPAPKASPSPRPRPARRSWEAPLHVRASGGASGNPVTLSIDPSAKGSCSISGATVTFVAVGTCVIDANQAGNASYAAATQVQQSFAVLGTQSITFTSTPPSPAVVGGTYPVTASGGASGNPVTLSIDPSANGSCSISGATVTFVAVGTCVIDANQAGNASYEAATQLQQSFAVLGTQSITFTSTPPNPAVVGGTYPVTASGGASGNPVTLSIDPSANGSCSISGTTVTFVAVGTCVIDANQAGNAGYKAATQVQQSFAVSASGSSSLAPTSPVVVCGTAILDNTNGSGATAAPASTWTSGNDYALGAVVTNASAYYVNILGVSNDTTAPGSDSTHWLHLSGGLVTVPAGDDSSYVGQTFTNRPDRLYYFVPGIHYLDTGGNLNQFNQIQPDVGDVFEGAGPSSVIDGQAVEDFAFDYVGGQSPDANDVFIENLTVQHFAVPAQSAAVNMNGGDGWIMQYDNITNNSIGAGVEIGTNNVVNDNCLTNNGQYGFTAVTNTDIDPLTIGPKNITLTNNEISYNDAGGLWDQSARTVSYSVSNNVATITTTAFDTQPTQPNGLPQTVSVSGMPSYLNGTWAVTGASNCYDDLTQQCSFTFAVTHANVSSTSETSGTVSDPNSCGCSGGGKFWHVNGATVTGNYVHDNGGVGIWADTDNAGFDISHNYVSDNRDVGIMYEVSYNAQITDNTLVQNAIGEGTAQDSPGFPDGAIYISESGGDSRVSSSYSGQLLISGNILTDNWGGVILWENANRYCSDGSDNACTLVNPSVYTTSSCAANLSEKSPVDYYDNCRWKTQNVLVEDNTLNFDPANVDAQCTVANLCGFNGLFSDYGTSLYGNTRVGAVTFQQNNLFEGNTYNGPWNFWAWSMSNLDNPVTWSEWTAPVTDQCDTAGELSSGTCSSGFGQDAGSTLG